MLLELSFLFPSGTAALILFSPGGGGSVGPTNRQLSGGGLFRVMFQGARPTVRTSADARLFGLNFSQPPSIRFNKLSSLKSRGSPPFVRINGSAELYG